jgi:hypothetical protein
MKEVKEKSKRQGDLGEVGDESGFNEEDQTVRENTNLYHWPF